MSCSVAHPNWRLVLVIMHEAELVLEPTGRSLSVEGYSLVRHHRVAMSFLCE